jgi:hypothetical protein
LHLSTAHVSSLLGLLETIFLQPVMELVNILFVLMKEY